MSAFAYLLPPLTGLVALFGGRNARARFHGLQSIVFGALWPALLWLCSFLSAALTQAAFGLGGLLWLLLLGAALAGRDVQLPLVGSTLARAAEVPPGAPPRK